MSQSQLSSTEACRIARPRGRPRIPIDQRPVLLKTKVSPALADAICRVALHQRISIYKLLARVLGRVFRTKISGKDDDRSWHAVAFADPDKDFHRPSMLVSQADRSPSRHR